MKEPSGSHEKLRVERERELQNTIGVAAAVKKFDWLATEFAASRAQPGGQTWAASEFAISPNSPKTGLPHSWTVNLSDNAVGANEIIH